MPIPKTIHQTHFTKDGLPGPVKENISRLMQLNPGWEYKFYDDADIVEFIQKHYSPEVLGLYNKINPAYGAARADLFRYLLIYKVGGAYFDIKSAAIAPLDRIINGSDYVLTHWSRRPNNFHHLGEREFPRGEYQQWHVIGAPEHPFLKAVLDLVFDNIENYSVSKFGVGRFGVIRTTGPIPYTLAIHPLVKTQPHRFYYRNKECALQYTALSRQEHEDAVYKTRTHYSRLSSPVVLSGSEANASKIESRISSYG